MAHGIRMFNVIFTRVSNNSTLAKSIKILTTTAIYLRSIVTSSCHIHLSHPGDLLHIRHSEGIHPS